MKDKIYIRLFTVFLFLIIGNSYAQGNSCENVEPFCAGDQELVFPNSNYANGSDSNGQVGPNYGCLLTQPYPAWFYLQIENSGNLRFLISQFRNEDGSGVRLDVDYIVWGPFQKEQDYCGNTSLNEEKIVDCSYSENAVEAMSIQNAEAGDIYVVMITNFSRSPGFISLQQTNATQAGAGATDCSILKSTLGEDRMLCGEDEFVLDGTTEGATSYRWYRLNENTRNYELLTGESNSTLTVRTDGNYKVVVNDAQGQTAEDDVNISFYEQPVASLPKDFSVCSEEGEPVDLSLISSEILAGNLPQENYRVEFYESAEAAAVDEPISNPTSFNFTGRIEISAKVVGIISGCESALISFDVVHTPFPDPQLDPLIVACTDSNGNLIEGLSLGKNLGSGYAYEWRDENGSISSEAILNFETVPSSENYTLLLTDIENGCTRSFMTQIQLYSAPEEVLVQIKGSDFTGGTIVTAEAVPGPGIATTYQYQLDQGSWQETPVFTNVPPGSHLVRAREVNGCGITVSERFDLIGYMRFFTPNSDGHNDVWQIKDTPGFQINRLFIFDRFGKLLKQISNTSGWDGSIGGRDLPADDYWFKVEYFDEKNGTRGAFMGNFSLLR